MLGISKLEAYGIILVVLALAIAGAYFKGHHSGYIEGTQEVQVKFDKFVNDTTAAGLKAKQDAITKEQQDATQIANAVVTRDAALARMRAAEAAASAARSRLPLTPRAAAGSSVLCFEPQAISAAVERYRGRVRGLAESGDETTVDAKALIDSWPKQQGAVR
jgi:hypothetical protein